MLSNAFKSLRRSPGLSIAAVFCIGLGAAATAALATLISALLIRPLPFPEADRLVRIWLEQKGGDPRVSLSIPEFEDLSRVSAFDRFIGTARVRVVAPLGGGAERLRGEGVSRQYFETFGITAALGRVLIDDDHQPASAPALVLSHGAWTRFFGADPTVIGQPLRTARAVYTIVGVTQAGFDGTVEDDIVEFFIPVEHYEPRSIATNRNGRSAWAVARLAQGATLADAQAQIAGIGMELSQKHPEHYRDLRPWVEPMGESWRHRLRGGAAMLFAAAVLLLAIAAINVACLLVARVLDRRHELAVRAALGAGSRQIGGQLLAEVLILTAGGAVLGAIGGPLLLESLLRLSPVALPHYVQPAPDGITLAITIGALSVAAIIAGTAPARIAVRTDPVQTLRGGGRTPSLRHGERRWTSLLIAGETTLTLVLLVVAGLLLRSFSQLAGAELGFATERVARLAVTLSATDAGGVEQLPAAYDRLRESLLSQPGVERVGLVSATLPPWDSDRARVINSNVDSSGIDSAVDVGVHLADHGLLPTLDIKIVAGRNIAETDTANSSRVGVISAALAGVLGGERVIGQQLAFAPSPMGAAAREPFRVVGIAADAAWDGLVEQDTRRYLGQSGASARTSRYDVYLPLSQSPSTIVSIGVRTAGDPAPMIAPLRQAIAKVAPTSAVHWTSTMGDEIALEYAPARFYSVIVALFAGSALLLTSIGLFALLSHAAAQRKAEMGVRLALGATPRSASLLLLRGSLTPFVIGVVGGLAVAALALRLVGGLLYGVGAFDAATFVAATLVMLTVSIAAGLLPARRVAAVDPVLTLRGD
jgi:predicted permease